MIPFSLRVQKKDRRPLIVVFAYTSGIVCSPEKHCCDRADPTSDQTGHCT